MYHVLAVFSPCRCFGESFKLNDLIISPVRVIFGESRDSFKFWLLCGAPRMAPNDVVDDLYSVMHFIMWYSLDGCTSYSV